MGRARTDLPPAPSPGWARPALDRFAGRHERRPVGPAHGRAVARPAIALSAVPDLPSSLPRWPRDRDEGRTHAPRARPVGAERAPGLLDIASQVQPAKARHQTDRAVAASSHRPEGAARRTVRRRASTAG